MKKFLVIYHAPIEALAQMANVAPEDQAKGMDAWMQWAKKCGDSLTDMGSPLINGTQIDTQGQVTNSTKSVSGYSILQASDMEEAKKMMDGHPHLNGWHPACTIELHEFMPLPGM